MITLPRVSDEQKQMNRFMTWVRHVNMRLRVIGLASEQSYVMENLSMLLSSGMDVISALRAIEMDAKSKRMKTILNEVVQSIENGSTLWSALETSRLLSGQVIALIHIGEDSGKLADNLNVIAIQNQKERDFTSKVRSAMMYPILVLGIAIVIALGMAWFVLPRLVTVFSELKIQLPLITRIIIAIAKYLQAYGNIVIPAIAIIIPVIVYFLFFFSKTRWFGQSILFLVPGASRLIREIELARMGYVMGTLLSAGLPIVQTLESLAQSTTFYSYIKFFKYIRSQIEDGQSWEQALYSYKRVRRVIPTPIQQMIIAGDSSGQLPQTFMKIGQIFESKTDTTAKNLTVILEPVLLVAVWLGVASVALAIIMPIYGLIGGLTTSEGDVRNVSDPNALQVSSVPEVTIAPTPSITPAPPQKVYLKVIATPSGILNVRLKPGDTNPIITKIIPGEQYEYTDEQKVGNFIWYNIQLPTEKAILDGWVIQTYVQLVNQDGTPAE